MARTLEPSFRSKPAMDVKFLDVGQGDAILIEYPNGKNALIDAGRSDSVIDAALKAEGIRKIDSGQIHTTQTYQAYLDAIDASGAKFEVAEIGDNVSDDSNASATVLAVESNAADSSEGSIVIMLTYGLTDFLLTGDAGLEAEDYLMARYDDLEAEILKVSHHGSATGTGGDFIEAASPQDAILSYGDNAYGHPHNEVVQDLLNYDANVYSTHEQGTIEINTIGNSYTINVDPWRDGNKPTPAPAPTPAPKPTPKPVEPEYQTFNNLKITAKNLKTDVVTIKNTGSTNVKMKG
jgi:beta-lactamase superfamily II metal-dependent hydrolase